MEVPSGSTRVGPGAGHRPHSRVPLVVAIGLIAAVVLTSTLLLTGQIGSRTSSNGGATTRKPITSATAAPTAAPTPGTTTATTPSILPGFTASEVSGGSAAAGLTPVLAAVRAARHDGYDRFVIDLGSGPLQAYVVTPQPTAHFAMDGSGLPVTLQGSHGVKIVIHDATAHPSYKGLTDLHLGLPAIKEARLVGDFEGYMSWALGIDGPGYIRVQTLTGPSRLVVDVQQS